VGDCCWVIVAGWWEHVGGMIGNGGVRQMWCVD
jgi:hypothetical protein